MFGLLKVKTKRFHQNATKALTSLSNEQHTTTVYHPLTIIKYIQKLIDDNVRCESADMSIGNVVVGSAMQYKLHNNMNSLRALPTVHNCGKS